MSNDTQILGLNDYAAMVWRRKFLILLLILLMAVPAAILSALQTPVYTSSAQMALSQRQVDSNLSVTSSELTDTKMSTEAAFLTGDEVVRRASARGATSLPRAQTTTKTNLIDVIAQDSNADGAATTANAFADAYVGFRSDEESRTEDAAVRQLTDRSNDLQRQIDDLSDRSGGITSGPLITALTGLQQQQTSVQGQLNRAIVDRSLPGLSASVIRRAEPAVERTSPNPVRNGLVAAALAVILGIALSVVLGTMSLRKNRGPANHSSDTTRATSTSETPNATPEAPQSTYPVPPPARFPEMSRSAPGRDT